MIKTIETNEVDAVSGGGLVGYYVGYRIAKELGASDQAAHLAGQAASAAEDAL